jgi:hypothetical protein
MDVSADSTADTQAAQCMPAISIVRVVTYRASLRSLSLNCFLNVSTLGRTTNAQ